MALDCIYGDPAGHLLSDDKQLFSLMVLLIIQNKVAFHPSKTNGKKFPHSLNQNMASFLLLKNKDGHFAC